MLWLILLLAQPVSPPEQGTFMEYTARNLIDHLKTENVRHVRIETFKPDEGLYPPLCEFMTDLLHQALITERKKERSRVKFHLVEHPLASALSGTLSQNNGRMQLTLYLSAPGSSRPGKAWVGYFQLSPDLGWLKAKEL